MWNPASCNGNSTDSSRCITSCFRSKSGFYANVQQNSGHNTSSATHYWTTWPTLATAQSSAGIKLVLFYPNSGGMRGGPSRFPPRPWGTNRRCHGTRDKWRRYCIMVSVQFWSFYCKDVHFTILKMIGTSGFLTAIKCTKFIFGQGSAPDPSGELTALTQTPVTSLKKPYI